MSKQGINAQSISRKYFMAAAGAFLMLFLVSHLGTNLLLLVNDGGESYGNAVDFLLANPIIKVVEYVLFASFIIHIIIGIVLEIHNRRARPVGYYVNSKSETSAFSRFMIHTGVVIFIFLLLHLYHFFFVKLGLVDVYGGATEGHEFYPMVIHTFTNPWLVIIYVISVIVLGFHLKHAFQSAFQTFGLNHDKYMPSIKVIGTVFSIVIALGFAVIPIYFYFTH